MELSKKAVAEAILTNNRIDFSASIFGRANPIALKLQDPFPPVLEAAFRYYSGHTTSENADPSGPLENVRDFEDLTLFVRHKAFGLDAGSTAPGWFHNASGFEEIDARDVVEGVGAAAEILSQPQPAKSLLESLTSNKRQRAALKDIVGARTRSRRGLQINRPRAFASGAP